jgi:hypothetical protein
MCNFPQGQENQGIARRHIKKYAAQATPQNDAEVVEKGHFCHENNSHGTVIVTRGY